MKHLRPAYLRPATVLTFLAIIALPGNTCSPGDPEAVFVRRSGPDTPYKTYAAGHLGIILPTYRPRHLAIAYDYLNGRPLTPQEQSQAEAAERTINWQSYGTDASDTTTPAPGMHQWIAAHETAIPGTINPLTTDRKVPGEDYQSFTNCLDDAFLNAAHTLTARQQSYGKSSPEVLDWLHAQDAVFSNCGGQGTMPQPAPANAPLWLQQDRAYQLAAANFYALNFDAALTGFRTIASDHASPWHIIAPYLVVRTLIRQTTVVPQPSYNKPDAAAAETKRIHDDLTAALQQLDTILHDPTLKAIHPAASNLRDLVAARVEPAAQAQVLAQRITAAPHGLDLRHNLVDLTYILNNSTDDSGAPLPAAKQIAATPDPTGLLAFFRTINTPTEPPFPNPYETTEPETPAQTKSRLAIQHTAAKTAFAQWQSSKKPAWLIAALTLAQPDDPFTPQLITATQSLPPNSPAYTTATYNRLRLEAATSVTRTELITLLPTLEKSESRSTINLFTALLTPTAPTLSDFIKTAPRIPSAADFEGSISAPTDIPTPELCGIKPDAAKTPLFDSDAATILNQRLPLRLLREAATSSTLPPNLRFQLANATLTRAVLLDDPATVAAVSPALSACQPALKPWLDRYNSATTPDQRHLQGLFLLMRFPSAEPLVRTGNQRSTGFATYSDLRDNWWAGNTQYIQPTNPTGDYDSGVHTVTPDSPKFKPALFTVPITPAAQLASPPFLTATDTAEANKEILTLQHIPCASDYFATQTLNWVKTHPTDPNNSELLGFAMRVVRNASRTSDTKELNHQLFDTLHKKYPASEWAKRYTTWE